MLSIRCARRANSAAGLLAHAVQDTHRRVRERDLRPRDFEPARTSRRPAPYRYCQSPGPPCLSTAPLACPDVRLRMPMATGFEHVDQAVKVGHVGCRTLSSSSCLNAR